jgi:hypothetical protein
MISSSGMPSIKDVAIKVQSGCPVAAMAIRVSEVTKVPIGFGVTDSGRDVIVVVAGASYSVRCSSLICGTGTS